jgi:hypothetical protein
MHQQQALGQVVLVHSYVQVLLVQQVLLLVVD